MNLTHTGKDTPAGMVIGNDGNTMTNSNEISKDLVNGNAAFAPLGGIGEELGGYKGYRYAIFSLPLIQTHLWVQMSLKEKQVIY